MLGTYFFQFAFKVDFYFWKYYLFLSYHHYYQNRYQYFNHSDQTLNFRIFNGEMKF